MITVPKILLLQSKERGRPLHRELPPNLKNFGFRINSGCSPLAWKTTLANELVTCRYLLYRYCHVRKTERPSTFGLPVPWMSRVTHLCFVALASYANDICEGRRDLAPAARNHRLRIDDHRCWGQWRCVGHGCPPFLQGEYASLRCGKSDCLPPQSSCAPTCLGFSFRFCTHKRRATALLSPRRRPDCG